MAMPRTVHIIEDDSTVRESIRLLLVAEGYDARTYVSAIDFLGALEPDETGCVVTDVSLPGMSGVELLTHIMERGLSLPVIVMTGQANVPMAVSAMKQGAVDFMEKPFSSDALVAAVRKALSGAVHRRDNDANVQDIQTKFASLSAREQEVLDGLIKGKPNKIIAHELGISHRTVEIHRSNLMKKTQAGSLSELVRMSMIAVNRQT
jgi:two-component system response regulator FixJ